MFSIRRVIRFIFNKMGDTDGLLTLAPNLKNRTYRNDGMLYINSLDGESTHKRSKNHSCSLTANVPHDKNNLDLVKKFVYALCQEYLGGIWKRIDIKDFEITKPNGGLSNHLYKCEIKNLEIQPIRNEPRKIFVRLYGENHQINSAAILKDIIVSTILSDFKIGPKLYGIFPQGRLEELIDASPMNCQDMYVPEYSCQIGEVLAQFHTLEMPFNKKPNWLFDTTYSYMRQINEENLMKESDITRFNILKGFNLEQEFEDLKMILKSLRSSVVFCHNDINVGNILKLESKLMVIDYEYGGYNYRGYDIGNYFCEMMFDNNTEVHPYFSYSFNSYPNRKQQLNFIRAYIKKFNEINESKQLNNCKLNEEQLLNEANHFALASSLFWIMWSLCQALNSTIKFDYLDYALARADAYFKHKKQLFPNGYGASR